MSHHRHLHYGPMYDGVDVNVTSNVTWFHLDHDMVSRRIYKLSFYVRRALHYTYPLHLREAQNPQRWVRFIQDVENPVTFSTHI